MSHSAKTLKAFTLVEVIVSVFIFVIIMGAVSNIFSSAFFSYRATRNVQRDVENAQYAINIMAKELRTSTVVSADDVQDHISFFDYSQSSERCFQYRIHTQKLQVARRGGNFSACDDAGFGDFETISTGVIDGRFFVIPSEKDDPKKVGKVTLSLEISEDETHFARIQSTVSLRDYSYVGIGTNP